MYKLSVFVLLLFIFNCSDSENLYETLSHLELDELFPGSYNDIELTKTENRIWVDEEDTPYSGEQNVFKSDTDELVYTHFYKDGFLFETLIHNVNPQGTPEISAKTKYFTDSAGNLITQTFKETETDSLILIVQFTDSGTTRNSKYYHRNGNLWSDKTMLWPVNEDGIKYHGLFTEFNNEGNIIKQERYENGSLIETIK